MKEVEAYLDRATRGLIGSRRGRVRDELSTNLYQLALDHQVHGADAEEALQLALRDFGPPERLALGLQRVHTLPGVLRGLLAAVALAGGAYAAARAFPPPLPDQAPPAHEARP